MGGESQGEGGQGRGCGLRREGSRGRGVATWGGAHHVGYLRLRGGVDVPQRHGAVLHHEAHLGELGLRALAALGARVGQEDVRDLAAHQEGVELWARGRGEVGLIYRLITEGQQRGGSRRDSVWGG